MTQKNPDPRAAVLRAAGHPEAANLLDALARINTPADAAPETPPAPLTPEQAREQQGRAMLEQIQAQTGRNVINTPLLGDAA